MLMAVPSGPAPQYTSPGSSSRRSARRRTCARPARLRPARVPLTADCQVCRETASCGDARKTVHSMIFCQSDPVVRHARRSVAPASRRQDCPTDRRLVPHEPRTDSIGIDYQCFVG